MAAPRIQRAKGVEEMAGNGARGLSFLPICGTIGVLRYAMVTSQGLFNMLSYLCPFPGP